MAIIRKDKKSNKKYYSGFLSLDELEKADALLEKLQTEIPEIENKLEETYGNTLEYKFEMGKILASYFESEKIKRYQRLYFWDEIKEFASKKSHPQDRSNKRSFYEYCYKLYKMGEMTAFKLPWRVWNDLFDRITIIESDERLTIWVSNNYSKMKQETLRNFYVCLNYYLKNKDTSILSDDEIYNIYDELLLIARSFNDLFLKYFNNDKNKLTKARRENFSRYKKKYFHEVIDSINNVNYNSLLREEIFKIHFHIIN